MRAGRPPLDPASPAAQESKAAELERSLEARLAQARQQARAEGEAAGMQKAAQQMEPVIAGLKGVMQEFVAQRPRLRAESEEDLVKLAVAIARRVLHREIAIDPEAILGLVKAAATKLNARDVHRLRVSPEDAAVIREIRTKLDLPAAVEITVDGSLRKGSALFETSRGDLDASIDTQLSEIERGLADVVRRRMR